MLGYKHIPIIAQNRIPVMGRKPLGKVQKHFRIKESTADRLNQIAIELGYVFGVKKDGKVIPATGELLDAIADGDVKLKKVR